VGWTTADAPSKTGLAACNQCGLCLPVCPTFRLTGRETASPRGRLMAMNAVDQGLSPVDEVFDDIMSFCLQCRACEAVCPSLAPFGSLMESARIELGTQRPTAQRRVRRVITGRLLASPAAVRAVSIGAALAQRVGAGRVLPAAMRRTFTGLRRIPLIPPSTVGRSFGAFGPERGRVALLAGCVMDPWFGPVRDATIEVLRRAGYRVEIPSGQTCCGALAAHDGDGDGTRRMAQRNVDAFSGADLVIVDSAGCGAHLKEYGHWATGGEALASRVRDVTEFVARLIGDGVLPTLESTGIPVAVQDPCHLRHAQRIVEAPRAILRAGGFTPIEIDEVGLCCGAAGLYSVLNPETSAQLGERKAAQVEASGAQLVSSANPGCEMQLRAHLMGSQRVAHPVELYREALAGTRSAR
jgi:glycolate oxidase iron-sulfur subunit